MLSPLNGKTLERRSKIRLNLIRKRIKIKQPSIVVVLQCFSILYTCQSAVIALKQPQRTQERKNEIYYNVHLCPYRTRSLLVSSLKGNDIVHLLFIICSHSFPWSPQQHMVFSECYIESTSFSYHIPDRTFIYFILQWCSCYINFFTLNSRVSQSQRGIFNVVSKGAHIANH